MIVIFTSCIYNKHLMGVIMSIILFFWAIGIFWSLLSGLLDD